METTMEIEIRPMTIESAYPGEIQAHFNDRVQEFKEAHSIEDYNTMSTIMYSLLEEGLTGIEHEIEESLSVREKRLIGWI